MGYSCIAGLFSRKSSIFEPICDKIYSVKYYSRRRMMNIAIDIDDTLTDSFDYFQPYVAEYFASDTETLRQRDISYSNLPEEWKRDELGFCRRYFDRVVPDTPFKPDAAASVRKLRSAGHRIVIITGRTDLLYTDPYATTEEELRRGGIEYDKLICTFDKGGACRAENISVIVDDMIANCDAAEAAGIPAIVFDSKANRDDETLHRRAADWNAVLHEIEMIERGYPDRQTAEELLCAALELNPGPWGDHSRTAAMCAERIASAAGMDAEKAYIVGLLHDIGRRFLVRDLGHIYYGYRYMMTLGYSAVARVCLTHSFPPKDFDIYIGKLDIPDDEVEEVRRLLDGISFDDYDRLIQLCDAAAGAGEVLDIEERMADVKRRYGNYPQAQWDRNIELMHYFGDKCGRDIYDICR